MAIIFASRRIGGGLLCIPTHISVCEQTSDYAKMLAGSTKPLKRTKTHIFNLEPSSPQIKQCKKTARIISKSRKKGDEIRKSAIYLSIDNQ